MSQEKECISILKLSFTLFNFRYKHINNMINIKCIGFSVTAYMDDSYPIDLQRKLDLVGDDKFSVSYVSLGGLSIDSMPYLMDKMVKNGQDQIIVLEIATSWYSLFRSDFNKALESIKEIVNFIEIAGSKIIFLNLYRKDIDDKDIVVRAIEQVAAGKHLVIDLKKYFRTLLKDTGNDLTVDGVHPNKDAISLISDRLFKEVIGFQPHALVNHSAVTVKSSIRYQSWLPEDPGYEEIFFDNRKGFKSRALKIKGGEHIEFDLPEGSIMSGIFFVLGPDTGITECFLDNQKIEVEMQDEMSFYRRLGYKELESRKVNRVKLYKPNLPSQIKLSREPWETVDGVNCYLVGIALARELIKC